MTIAFENRLHIVTNTIASEFHNALFESPVAGESQFRMRGICYLLKLVVGEHILRQLLVEWMADRFNVYTHLMSAHSTGYCLTAVTQVEVNVW